MKARHAIAESELDTPTSAWTMPTKNKRRAGFSTAEPSESTAYSN
jgi:hypothetical protein